MFDKIIKEIRNIELRENASVYPKFSEGYPVYRIDEKNFEQIDVKSGKRIAFVDGGNAEIYSDGNISLSLVRSCGIVFQNKKKTCLKKFEFFILVKTFIKNDDVHYNASIYALDGEEVIGDMEFNSLDETIKIGKNRADIKSISNAIRRLMELMMAERISNDKLADIICIDGNLQETLTHEDIRMIKLQKSCLNNGVILTGISKTSSVYCSDGRTLSNVLSSFRKNGKWVYGSFVEIENEKHKAEMFLVKLHEKSSHSFRFEILKSQKENAKDAIEQISLYANDPVFIGYPYGLIEADRIARVTNDERESLKNRLMIMLGKNSKDPHEILDKISF